MAASDEPIARSYRDYRPLARYIRRVLLPLSVLVAALVVASVASATHPYDSIFPTANASWNCTSGGGTPEPGDVYCQTDDVSLSFWIAGGASTSERGQIRSVLNYEYGDTVLNPSEVPNGSVVWQASGTGETDLIMDEVELDNYLPVVGAAGAAWCDDAIDAIDCDQHYAFLDDDVTPTYGATVFTKVACHEIGHTVGLTHPVDASPAQQNGDARFRCMNQGLYNYTSPGDNNKHQINIVYG